MELYDKQKATCQKNVIYLYHGQKIPLENGASAKQ